MIVWLRPFALNELKASIMKNAAAKRLVKENLMKTAWATNSKAEILDSYNKYQTLLNRSSQQNCYRHQQLIDSLQSLADKYQLTQGMQAKIFRSFMQETANQDANLLAHLHSYNLHLTFSMPSLSVFLSLIKEMSALLPDASKAVRIEIENKSVLNPTTILKLSANKPADLIEVKYKVVIHELAAD